MATKPPLECPICHAQIRHGHKLEHHLIDNHRKRQLAKFVATETVAMESNEISE
ncbi:hypothetical protein HALLA_08330 [Halostagnicola larsenii XH-48]|uniref:Uncharacterized protein n=1 Tax=Halostagnicola larsenii XH-48 TaxID=797299 RepID=W0JJU6_9EURY|nr:hypothetical protein [Halostagnicola larsenii]AHF98868.1 hypothetical protein HALLA_08330 [Halostagnicola larsenii XH-48]